MRLSVVSLGRARPLYNAEPGRVIYKLAQKHERAGAPLHMRNLYKTALASSKNFRFFKPVIAKRFCGYDGFGLSINNFFH